jgi:hypothetical protein
MVYRWLIKLVGKIANKNVLVGDTVFVFIFKLLRIEKREVQLIL